MFDGQDKKHHGAKQSNNTEKGFDRRQNQTITIRRDKREKLLDKKRRMAGGDEHGGDSGAAVNMDPMAYDITSNPALIPLELLPQFVEMARSEQQDYAFHGTLMIRKLLSVESNPPIEEVVATNVVPLFVHYMSLEAYPRLQFEAAWALTNIASGTAEHTHLVIEAGAVPLFISLLSSPDEDCREQGTWAIGNLGGEGDKCRDYVLDLGGMGPLLNLITSPNNKITLLRNAVWALSNLCRGKPQPKLEHVSIALPVLASLLNHHDDEVVVDAAWAISYISDGANDRIQAVLESGVLARIIQLLQAPTAAMQTPAIRTIGNIATGNDRQTQMVINSGGLPPLHFLLQHTKRAIKKETCWTLSNICAGHRDQLQAVINANLFPQLLKCIQAPELEVKKEAVWCVANACSGGTKEQNRYLVSIGVVVPLCELLQIFDPKILSVALEALAGFLEFAEEEKALSNSPRNVVVDAIAECGGIELIEKLQTHQNNDVYHNAVSILETYFVTEGVTGGNEVSAAAAGGFQFDPNAGSFGPNNGFSF
ncbi:importin alpha subunit, putative [Bodo saltans]|uniref:Importin subunit alpha n=1 Tax=Bodo saltans TaxID=75058 RepID=A0A0S4KNG1_BODSA|nr:importin alpha subunit, putative [Bodo saltans]|eukprot:CUI14425.1 importin alpha subunit, putative [Bodo saltans]